MRTPDEIERALRLLEQGLANPSMPQSIATEIGLVWDALRWVQNERASHFGVLLDELEATQRRMDAEERARAN